VGIRFTMYNDNSDSLKYCDVKYAGADNGIGIYLLRKYKKLDRCLIDSTLGTGVYVDGGDSCTVSNCVISNSTGWGIYDKGPATIQDCQIIYNDSGGIHASGLGIYSGNEISFNNGYLITYISGMQTKLYILLLQGIMYFGQLLSMMMGCRTWLVVISKLRV
jgi:hypothetical protein